VKSTGLQCDELKEIFGESAFVLERMVVKRIYSGLGLGTPPLSFEVAIEQAKQAHIKGIPILIKPK